MKKEITLLIGSLAGGGAEGVCVTLANGFIRKNYKVNLIVLNLNNAVNKDRLDNNVNLIDLNVSNVRFSFKKLRKYIRENRPEEILVFDHLLSVMLVLIRYTVSCKYKIIARNINTLSKELASYNSFWYSYIVRPLVTFFYRKVDFIINQSKGMMDDLLDVYPEFINKTTYIHNPVNETISLTAKKSKIETNNRNYFLCVGRLEEQKSFNIAITAFSEVIKSYPSYRLKIIGIGRLEYELKKLVCELNISDKVDFEGFQQDVIPYYKEAKATILTSKYEGFPNVLVESITLGTPIISFNCPSGPSEIINSSNGFLINEFDINQLIRQMKKICTIDFNFETIKNDAKKYNIENVIDMYVSVFKEVRE